MTHPTTNLAPEQAPAVRYEDVPLSKITVEGRRRGTSKAKVEALARSILDIGLLGPIGLTEQFKLIHGRHRLEAFDSLGRDTIPAIICDFDELHAELAEIDENLLRNQLSAIDEAKALKRRKVIYLELHPETRRGGDWKSKEAQSKRHNVALISFTDDTAQKTGQTRRNVERAVKLAEDITDAAATQLAGTKVADNKAELKKLAALDEEQQLEVATKIGQGKAKSVAEALGKKRGATAAADELPPGVRRGVGVDKANEAIDCLKKIPKKDRLRKRGFQIVSDWISRDGFIRRELLTKSDRLVNLLERTYIEWSGFGSHGIGITPPSIPRNAIPRNAEDRADLLRRCVNVRNAVNALLDAIESEAQAKVVAEEGDDKKIRDAELNKGIARLLSRRPHA
jgi:ParB family chromosome partitioning protein